MSVLPIGARRREVSATTRFVGVIGEPVDHSLSPRLHNAAYEALGLDLCYGAFPVSGIDARAAIDGARALGFVGLSVTTPHKQAAAFAADQRSTTVELLGVANTIVFRSGMTVAYSTDGEGLIADLELNCDFRLEEKRCAVIGAGGAARAVVLALADAGASSVLVVNRTESRAREAALLAGTRGHVGSETELSDVALVVNATSLGLIDRGSDPEADATGHRLASKLGEGQLVVDLSYRSAETPFLEAAALGGATVRNGLGMLVHQAARQFELFVNVPAPLAVMWEAVGVSATS